MWIAALYDADDAIDYNEHQMWMEMMQMSDPEQDNADLVKQQQDEQDATDDAAQEWSEMQTQYDEDPQEQDGYYDGDWGYPTGYVDYPVEVMA
jgi:hypothetical protein